MPRISLRSIGSIEALQPWSIVESVFRLTVRENSKIGILSALLGCNGYSWKIEYSDGRPDLWMIGPFQKSLVAVEDYADISSIVEMEQSLAQIEREALEAGELIKARLSHSMLTGAHRSIIESNAEEIGLLASEASLLSIAPALSTVRSFIREGLDHGERVLHLNKSLAEQLRNSWFDHGYVGYFELLRYRERNRELRRLACYILP